MIKSILHYFALVALDATSRRGNQLIGSAQDYLLKIFADDELDGPLGDIREIGGDDGHD